jgi:hypothetical protein
MVQTALGANAPPQTIQATNAGDGALALSVSVAPGATWLLASVQLGGNIVFAFSTATLPRGVYTAVVTVADPIAIDAPQTVTVTVQVGDSPPPYAVDEYVAPGTVTDVRIYPPSGRSCPPFDIGYCPPAFLSSTEDGGQWLSVVVQRIATIDLPSEPVYVRLTPASGMHAGAYSGQVAITNSADNRVIPVSMCVTTEPIAAPSQTEIDVRLAQGSPPLTTAISLANAGMGELVIGNAVARGPGVTASAQNTNVSVTVTPGPLSPGVYNGSVAIHCNAVNCPLEIPWRVVIFLPGVGAPGADAVQVSAAPRPLRPASRSCSHRLGFTDY